MMNAMLLRNHAPINTHPLEYTKIPIPIPAEHEILVKVKACGVCRTDLHLIEGELPRTWLPIVPGHQIVGIVEELGPNCHRFKKGDRIGIAWFRHSCGVCHYCKTGQENLCDLSQYTGYHIHGGYAEYTKIHEDYAYVIPSKLTDEEVAPLLCAGIIGYRALKRCQLPKNGKLGMIGFGSAAHIVLQIALYQNDEVYVATRSKEHQELARKMGAKWVGTAEKPFPVEMDSVIIFAPAGDLVPIAMQSICKGGTVVSADIVMSKIPAMDYGDCVFHEKHLTSVESNTREDGRELLKLAAEIPIKPFVEIFPLKHANEALAKLKNDGIKGTALLKV